MVKLYQVVHVSNYHGELELNIHKPHYISEINKLKSYIENAYDSITSFRNDEDSKIIPLNTITTNYIQNLPIGDTYLSNGHIYEYVYISVFDID